MAGSLLLHRPWAGRVGLLVLLLLLLGLFRPSPALGARPVKEPRLLGAPSPPLIEAGAPSRFRRALPRGEAAGAVQELAKVLAHLLEAERQERARAEAQEAEDQQARVLAQLLRLWGAPRASDSGLGLDDDPNAPAAQLPRALLRARLEPAALAAQLVTSPASVLRTRPPAYDDSLVGPNAEDASDGDGISDLDPEFLRYLLGRLLRGSPDPEMVSTPRRFRRSADQDLGLEGPPEGVLGALLRVKRLETPAPQAPMRRLLSP
ncbi:proSAAS [Rhynchocyon petersi]